MIFVSTSNNVFSIQGAGHPPVPILQKEKKFWFFPKKTGSFFGICLGQNSKNILIATRENLGTPKIAKHGSDVYLFEIEWQTAKVLSKREILDCHDVHQIARFKNLLFLTDTGKNRICVFNLEKSNVEGYLNIGSERRDVHHINAVSVVENEKKLFIGLNNRGKIESEILIFPLDSIVNEKLSSDPIDNQCDKIKLDGLTHTHDIAMDNNKLFVCSSHQGKVFSVQPLTQVVHPGDWVRGIDFDNDHAWIGVSALAERSQRHDENLDGSICIYQKDNWHKKSEIKLKKAGQVNDILVIK